MWQTKLHRPAVTRTLVNRPRLLDILNQGINHRLILLCAPAGFGKTTLVSSWIESLNRRGDGESERLPAAWLTLDESESEIRVFVHYLIAALRTIFDNACVNTLKLLYAQQPLPLEHIAASLSNDIHLLPGNFLLVLDNFQEIQGDEVTNLLNELLLHWPNPLHLVLITRTSPHLPLARLRTNDQLTEIRSHALRFSTVETVEFMNQVVQTPLSGRLLKELEKRTEGWAGGLRLTALTLGTAGNLEKVLATLDGSHDMLVDYMVNEILMKQVPVIQDFLLRTSILDRFCVHVAKELTGEPDPAWTTQACLDWLEHEELFVVSLDNYRHWFRYHPLFRTGLRRKLGAEMPPEQIQALHRKAAIEFEREQAVDEAVKHALLANDLTLAAGIMARGFLDVVNRTDWQTMERWLRLLPEEAIQQNPWLLIIRAHTLHFHWRLNEVARVLSRIEALLDEDKEDSGGRITAEDRRLLHGQIAVLKGQNAFYRNELNLVVSYCTEALVLLPETWRYHRAGALFYLSLGMQAVGQGPAVERALHELYELLPDKTDVYALRLLFGLCFIYFSSGQLELTRQTAHVLQQQAARSYDVNIECWAHHFLGRVYYAWNELESAERHFALVCENRYVCHRFALENATAGLILIHQAKGQLSEAAALLELTSRSDIERMGHEADSTRSLRSWMMLKQGELTPAFRWADAFTTPVPDQMLYWLEIPHLTRARILLARGLSEDVAAAGRILDDLRNLAERTHNLSAAVEILALRTLVLDAQGKAAEARADLKRVVTLAGPSDHLQAFVTPGQKMRHMLVELAADEDVGDTVQRILAAFLRNEQQERGLIVSQPVGEDLVLIEALTSREMQVLSNLREPTSMKVIAQSLGITYATVKRHTINIYAKLGVNSRWDAVTRAVELGILPPP